MERIRYLNTINVSLAAVGRTTDDHAVNVWWYAD
jgi:hypothetical protein